MISIIRTLTLTTVTTLVFFILNIQGQFVPSSTASTIPTGATKPLCGAFNVMELCIRTNTEKQAGCIAFPDPRLCQCQYQQAVVTCYDLCKSDTGSLGERPRAEADASTLCQGYNNTQIFPPQQGNPSTPPSATSFPPSKAIPGQGVTTGLTNSRSHTTSLHENLPTRLSFTAFIALSIFVVLNHLI